MTRVKIHAYHISIATGISWAKAALEWLVRMTEACVGPKCVTEKAMVTSWRSHKRARSSKTYQKTRTKIETRTTRRLDVDGKV